MDKAPHRLRASVQKVLRELRPEALRYLKNPKFEVKIIQKPDYSVCAYFPFHRRRLIDRELHVRSETRVLLVFGIANSDELPRKFFKTKFATSWDTSCYICAPHTPRMIAPRQ